MNRSVLQLDLSLPLIIVFTTFQCFLFYCVLLFAVVHFLGVIFPFQGNFSILVCLVFFNLLV